MWNPPQWPSPVPAPVVPSVQGVAYASQPANWQQQNGTWMWGQQGTYGMYGMYSGTTGIASSPALPPAPSAVVQPPLPPLPTDKKNPPPPPPPPPPDDSSATPTVTTIFSGPKSCTVKSKDSTGTSAMQESGNLAWYGYAGGRFSAEQGASRTASTAPSNNTAASNKKAKTSGASNTSKFEGKMDIPAEINDEELKEFDRQFTQWEEQFEKWRVENKDHPDKAALQKYELDWSKYKSELVEKRNNLVKSKMEKFKGKQQSVSSFSSSETQHSYASPQSAASFPSAEAQHSYASQQSPIVFSLPPPGFDSGVGNIAVPPGGPFQSISENIYRPSDVGSKLLSIPNKAQEMYDKSFAQGHDISRSKMFQDAGGSVGYARRDQQPSLTNMQTRDSVPHHFDPNNKGLQQQTESFVGLESSQHYSGQVSLGMSEILSEDQHVSEMSEYYNERESHYKTFGSGYGRGREAFPGSDGWRRDADHMSEFRGRGRGREWNRWSRPQNSDLGRGSQSYCSDLSAVGMGQGRYGYDEENFEADRGRMGRGLPAQRGRGYDFNRFEMNSEIEMGRYLIDKLRKQYDLGEQSKGDSQDANEECDIFEPENTAHVDSDSRRRGAATFERSRGRGRGFGGFGDDMHSPMNRDSDFKRFKNLEDYSGGTRGHGAFRQEFDSTRGRGRGSKSDWDWRDRSRGQEPCDENPDFSRSLDHPDSEREIGYRGNRFEYAGNYRGYGGNFNREQDMGRSDLERELKDNEGSLRKESRWNKPFDKQSNFGSTSSESGIHGDHLSELNRGRTEPFRGSRGMEGRGRYDSFNMRDRGYDPNDVRSRRGHEQLDVQNKSHDPFSATGRIENSQNLSLKPLIEGNDFLKRSEPLLHEREKTVSLPSHKDDKIGSREFNPPSLNEDRIPYSQERNLKPFDRGNQSEMAGKLVAKRPLSPEQSTFHSPSDDKIDVCLNQSRLNIGPIGVEPPHSGNWKPPKDWYEDEEDNDNEEGVTSKKAADSSNASGMSLSDFFSGNQERHNGPDGFRRGSRFSDNLQENRDFFPGNRSNLSEFRRSDRPPWGFPDSSTQSRDQGWNSSRSGGRTSDFRPPTFERRPRGDDKCLRDQDRRNYHERGSFKDSREAMPPVGNRERSLEKGNANQMKFDSERGDSAQPIDVPLGEPAKIVSIEDLITIPGRFMRPPKIIIILRGLPGSGKSSIARMIKDKEVENGGSAPRILCLDDYFMVECEKLVTDAETGRKVKTKVMEYEFEKNLEETYRSSLIKSFKKHIDDGFFPFLIIDCINERLNHFREMRSYALRNGFEVYIGEVEADVSTCSERNIHNYKVADIEKMKSRWESLPASYEKVELTAFVQEAGIQEVEMDIEDSHVDEKTEKDVPETKKSVSKEEDDDDEEEEFKSAYFQAVNDLIRSKWDSEDAGQDERLEKLDGVQSAKKRLSEHKPQTIEDWLQLSNEYSQKASEPGKKRVRWADMEEKNIQLKARQRGFVVGQTDWKRMTDLSLGSNALVQIRYFDP